MKMSTQEVRKSWDQYFIEIASLVGSRSACLRRKVGALLVSNHEVVSTGYNGPPSGMTHCTDKTCLRAVHNIPSGQSQEVCRAVHAEQNCLISAAKHGVTTTGTTLYCNTFPCNVCAKQLIQAGITRVVYSEGYPDQLGYQALVEAGVEVQQYTGKE